VAIPGYEFFMRPVLDVIDDGAVHRRKDVLPAALEFADLTPEELEETISDGSSRAMSRIHWALEYLVQSGAIHRPNRGEMCITELGRTLLAENPTAIGVAQLKDLPDYRAWEERSRSSQRRRGGGDSPAHVDVQTGETPIELLLSSVEVLDEQTARQLVERLQVEDPVFLERAVLKLLHAMGYGGKEADTEHLGMSHDGGLDGVIRQDALGIERIYVQAKRYATGNNVGSADIRGFLGAITAMGAAGGVFITTSDFTFEARKFVEKSPKVILMNGADLGRNMVEYGVGVAETRVIRITEVDENFFDGD